MSTITFDFRHHYQRGERRESEQIAYQWDLGHVMEVFVPEDATYTIGYCFGDYEKTEDYAIDTKVQDPDGGYKLTAHIPNKYFERSGELRVYVVGSADDHIITTYEGFITIRGRLMPDDYVDDDPENGATQIIEVAREYATKSESFAVGGTGTRLGEDTDNAKYYKEQAEAVAESIPEDYSELSDDVDQLKNALSAEQTLVLAYDQENVVLYSGTTAHYDNWYSTDFVPCNEGDAYNVGAWGYNYNNTNICPLSFFNNNKEYIGGISGQSGGNIYRVLSGNFPDGTAYFKQTYYSNGGTDNYTIINSLVDIKSLDSKVNTLYDEKLSFVPVPVATELTSVVLYGGGTGTFGNWYSSDYVSCEDATKINVVAWCYASGNTNICPVSFFDANHNYIFGISGEQGTIVIGSNRLYQGEVVIPDNAEYFKITAFKGSEAAGYEKTSAKLYRYASDDFIKGLKIVCIGDSLTEGDMGADPYASMQNITPYNYPFWMQTYLQCDVENRGKSGYTTIQSWDNVVQNIDYSDKNTAIIMLGSNGGLTDTIDTDCAGDDYRNYANTNTGCYCKIIEYIMEQTNCLAQIILCTPPHVSTIRGSKRTATIQAAEVVRKIADRYCLPLIDIMKYGGFSDYNEDVFQPVDGLHFSVTGYKRLGTFIGSHIKGNNAIQTE